MSIERAPQQSRALARFTGHYPEGVHRFNTGVVRWQTRTAAWAFGLTDKYPGFSMAP